MKNFRIIAFTYKNIDLKDIGKLHIEVSQWGERLSCFKTVPGISELMYLSTCNRVEFLVVSEQDLTPNFLSAFFTAYNPLWNEEEVMWAVNSAQIFEGEEALKHLFNVASSVDSLVVGEREIITQVRSAYDTCRDLGLTGDLLRLVVKKSIETAKQIYTHTQIAGKPVSIVSLAYRKLKELNVKLDARFLIIGTGQTNTTMAKYLKKHKFKNFTVFNRTLDNAKKLARELNGKACPLNILGDYKEGFDVIITCTGSSDYIITKEIYTQLVGNDQSKKIVIDLSVPNDFDTDILLQHPVNLIEVASLKAIAEENLKERHKELDACNNIINNGVAEFRQLFKTRKVEQAMSEVPRKVREIREMALSTVFAKEVNSMDEPTKEVLAKILTYMEKKYISVPMKMAKDILIESSKLKN